MKKEKVYYPQDILEKCRSLLFEDIVCVSGYIIVDNKNFPKLSYKNYSVALDGLPSDEIIEETYGKKVNVTGYLSHYVHVNGGIYPRIRINKIDVLSDEEVLEDNYIKEISQQITENLKNKEPFGFSDYFIHLVNQGNFPIKIALIHGRGAQVQYDFINGIKRSFMLNIPLSDIIDIFIHETTISNDGMLSNTIVDIVNSDENVDAIYILRGGGSEEELNRIGGPMTALTISALNIPVYLALGHSIDKPNKLLSKVISDEFPTPSIAGTELGNILSLSVENLTKEREVKEKIQQLGAEQNKIIELQKQNENLNREISKYQKIVLASWILPITIIIILKLLKIL